MFATDAIGPAVPAVGNDAMIASVHKRINARGCCRHARRDANGIVTVLNSGHLLLEHFDGRVVSTGIAIAFSKVFVDRLLNEGRRHIDGCEDGTRLVVGNDTAVNDFRVHGATGNPVRALCTEGPKSGCGGTSSGPITAD